jgi:hypothetical protein
MVQFLSINFFFLGFLQFLLSFSKVPVFCVTLYIPIARYSWEKLSVIEIVGNIS